MAARPNTLRTLEYGKRLVDNQLARLNEMIAMAEKVLVENKTLTPEDIAGYKACIAIGKKQITQFTKLAEIALPAVAPAPARKRGRPSKAELEQLASARGEKVAKASTVNAVKAKAAPTATAAAPVAPVAAEPKKRGRKPKAVEAVAAPVVAAPTEAPKKRGRPPKAKAETVTAAPVQAVAAPAEAPKKRGRPPKSAAVPAVNVATVATDAAPKRGPGRPKGSKNKVLNGQNAEVQPA